MIEKILFTDRLVLRRSETVLSGMVTEYFIRNADFLKALDAAHDSEFYKDYYHKKVLVMDE